MYLLTALEIKWVPPRKHISGTAHSNRNATLVNDQYVEGHEKSTQDLKNSFSILSGLSLK